MSFTKSFTQGGQTQLHNLRMIRQVLGTTVVVSLIIGLLFVAVIFWNTYTLSDVMVVGMRQWAKIRAGLPFLDATTLNTFTYTFPNHTAIQLTCWDVLYNPRIAPIALKLEHLMVRHVWTGLYVMGGSFCVISGFWMWMGHKRQQTKILKGTALQSPSALKKQIQKMGASPLTLAGVPYPRHAEKEHTLICGTTGSGKTNTINSLLAQIRANGQKALIIDTTGGYVERFFNPETDHLLNPFDARSRSWSLWDECTEEFEFMEFAESFIPPSNADPFWANAGKQLLATTAFRLKNEPSLKRLLNLLLVAPFQDSFRFLAGSPAASYVDPHSEKTASNVRSSMVSALWSLRYLSQTGTPFSIRQWAQNKEDSSWLFIAGMPTQRETLKPLMSAWLSIAIKSLMDVPENPDYRLWFIVDELASLNKIPSLKQGLAEVRKYGGCFVIGFQNIHQLYALYRQDDAQTIISLLGTKLVFKSENGEATYLSKIFGNQDILEQSGSISYGAHQMRDGVSLSDHHKTKPIISATDIMALNPLEAYIKFPRNLPFAKLIFPITPTTCHTEKFIKREGEDIEETSKTQPLSAVMSLDGHHQTPAIASLPATIVMTPLTRLPPSSCIPSITDLTPKKAPKTGSKTPLRPR